MTEKDACSLVSEASLNGEEDNNQPFRRVKFFFSKIISGDIDH